MLRKDKTRQDKITRQDKTRQDSTAQDQNQEKPRQGNDKTKRRQVDVDKTNKRSDIT